MKKCYLFLLCLFGVVLYEIVPIAEAGPLNVPEDQVIEGVLYKWKGRGWKEHWLQNGEQLNDSEAASYGFILCNADSFYVNAAHIVNLSSLKVGDTVRFKLAPSPDGKPHHAVEVQKV
jgi:hypothetical protein